jgi:hypothetical protein
LLTIVVDGVEGASGGGADGGGFDDESASDDDAKPTLPIVPAHLTGRGAKAAMQATVKALVRIVCCCCCLLLLLFDLTR